MSESHRETDGEASAPPASRRIWPGVPGPDRSRSSVRKYPGILDLGELFSESVSEHGGHPRRGETQPNSRLGRAHPLPKIVLTVHPLCTVFCGRLATKRLFLIRNHAFRFTSGATSP